MDRTDMEKEVIRLLGEVRRKVNNDLNKVFQKAVEDKLKLEMESNIDTDVYIVMKRETLKSLADRVEDIESTIQVANNELDEAENSINEARYSVSDIDSEASAISTELHQILKESEVKSEQG